MGNILVADIGGTKIAAAIANESGSFISKAEIKSVSSDSESMFESLLSVFTQILDEGFILPKDVEYIGIGVPGVVDYKKGIAVYQNNLPWRDFPLSTRLADYFPNAKIILDNDVFMATYGEWKARKLNHETFVYFTVSTGISSCIINNEKFIRGAGMAGEIGFSAFLDNEEIKTLENLASGPKIEENAIQIYHDQSITTEIVFRNYLNHDEKATAILQRAARYIAHGLQQIFSVIDPHVMVVGGGVINNQPSFFELIKKELVILTQNPIQKNVVNRIEQSLFRGDAGLKGAFYKAVENKGANI